MELLQEVRIILILFFTSSSAISSSNYNLEESIYGVEYCYKSIVIISNFMICVIVCKADQLHYHNITRIIVRHFISQYENLRLSAKKILFQTAAHKSV